MCTKSALLYPTDIKDFLKKKPAAVCAGEKDSVETWHVFAHFFKEPEAMTCPLSKGG